MSSNRVKIKIRYWSDEIVQIRYGVDAVIQAMEKEMGGGYFKDALRYIRESRMMLGNLLGLDTVSPYRLAAERRKRGQSDEIPKELHKASDPFSLPGKDNYVGKLDLLRDRLSELTYMITDVRNIYYGLVPKGTDKEYLFDTYHQSAIEKITLARNYLGLELGTQRKERDESTSTDTV